MAHFTLKSRKFGTEKFYTHSRDDQIGDVYIDIRTANGALRDRRICEGGHVNHGTALTACAATLEKVVRRWHRQRLEDMRPIPDLVLPIFYSRGR